MSLEIEKFKESDEWNRRESKAGFIPFRETASSCELTTKSCIWSMYNTSHLFCRLTFDENIVRAIYRSAAFQGTRSLPSYAREPALHQRSSSRNSINLRDGSRKFVPSSSSAFRKEDLSLGS